MGVREVVLGAAAATALTLGLVAPVSAATGPVIGAASIGMTVNGIARTGPADTVPSFAGAIRLWDSGVAWRRMQPTKTGPIDWTNLDRAVSRARSHGMTDILYVLGSTPRWASVRSPKEGGDLYGPGTASHPAKDAYYIDYLRQVVARYKGVITGYEIWNESNAPNFYRGSPSQLAHLAVEARAAIKAIDPRAKVVGPSWMLRGWTDNRDAQVKALKKAGWPIDVLSVHSYPMVTDGPAARVRLLRQFTAQMDSIGKGATPIWDTETNFGNERAGYAIRSYHGAKASGWLAQAYLDSFRYGIARTYWYSWDTRFLGIDLTDTQGRPTAAAHSLAQLRSWLVGYRWGGCSTRGSVTRCRVPATSGARRTIVFTRSGRATLTLPRATRSVCTLGGSCSAPGGRHLGVTVKPRLVVGGRL